MTVDAHIPSTRVPRRLYVLVVVTLVLGVGIGVLLARDWGRSSSPGTIQGSGVAGQLDVRIGREPLVVVNADDNLVDLITTDVRDGRLVIANDGSFTTKSPLSVEVEPCPASSAPASPAAPGGHRPSSSGHVRPAPARQRPDPRLRGRRPAGRRSGRLGCGRTREPDRTRGHGVGLGQRADARVCRRSARCIRVRHRRDRVQPQPGRCLAEGLGNGCRCAEVRQRPT